MSLLEFQSVNVAWSNGEGNGVHALSDVSFTVQPGEFVSIMGPNGCGKSTILRLAAGILRPSVGRVLWGGAEITGPDIGRGLMPQQPRPFEWLRVRDNVAFGARMRGVGRRERHAAALKILDRLGLKAWALNYPSELSGGMRGRVSLAMTLANDPRLICLDESFGAMDYQTRLISLTVLLEMWRERHPTILMVTHHVSEAMVADRVLVFSGRPGRIVLDQRVSHDRERRLDDDGLGDAASRSAVESTVRTAALAAFNAEREASRDDV